MREIKFRVWDKLIKKMITTENVSEFLGENFKNYNEASPYSGSEWYPAYDILAIFDYFVYIQEHEMDKYNSNNEEKRFKLMQYTGLKDKNGKEIYEGDITNEGVVKYGLHKVSCCGCCYIYHECIGFYLENGEYIYADETTFKDLEVVGNIYDNPELLKEE